MVFQSDLLLHLEIVMLSFCYGKKHYNEEVFTLCFSFVMVKITTIKKCLPCCCSAKGHTACKAYRWKALVNGDRLIMCNHVCLWTLLPDEGLAGLSILECNVDVYLNPVVSLNVAYFRWRS